MGAKTSQRHHLLGRSRVAHCIALSRRQLSNALCDDFGLPPVIWDNHDRPGARIFNARVSNARLREIGFQPSVSSMLEPVAA